LILKSSLTRIYRDFRYTSAYSGRFVFFLLRVGMFKFLLLLLLVRVYRIPLSSYSALANDLAISLAVSLGVYLYRGLHSYEEMKKAVHASHLSG
jgi:hypothetical protein